MASAEGQPAAAADENHSTIAVDPEWERAYDTDSAYGDAGSNLTASITSSVFDYQFENGRRYHAYDAGRYPMPNDEEEADRMDCFHGMMLLLHDQKLHLAPIGDKPQKILDLGTGTGIWAMDMGDMYPSAEIVGNDLSPIQPNSVPPNVRFIVDNVENPWVGNPETYDYIHCRYLTAAIKDWPKLVGQIYDHVKPGGYVEFSDYDIAFKSNDDTCKGTNLERWIHDIKESCYALGCEPSPGPKLKQWVIDKGFVDVHEHVYEIPTGGWPYDKKLKMLGLWSVVHLLKGVEAFTLALFTRILGWSNQEVQVMLSLIRKDLNNPKIHAFQKYYLVWARKPDPSNSSASSTVAPSQSSLPQQLRD